MRLRPAASVVDEMEYLMKQGVNRFFITDSEFNEPEEHAKGICEEILHRSLQDEILWWVYTSPKDFSPELASLMKRAGCRRNYCSIDSACDEVLENLQKRHRVEHIVKAVEAARQADLHSVYCLTVGGPGETMTTLERTTEFLLRHRPINVDLVDVPGIRVYPNTPIADLVFREGFSRKNRNLRGKIDGNEELLFPVYYFSAQLGLIPNLVTTWRHLGFFYNCLFPKTRRGIVRLRLIRQPA